MIRQPPFLSVWKLFTSFINWPILMVIALLAYSAVAIFIWFFSIWKSGTSDGPLVCGENWTTFVPDGWRWRWRWSSPASTNGNRLWWRKIYVSFSYILWPFHRAMNCCSNHGLGVEVLPGEVTLWKIWEPCVDRIKSKGVNFI